MISVKAISCSFSAYIDFYEVNKLVKNKWKLSFFCSINRDKHKIKQIITDCVGFKRVVLEEFKIETETHFLVAYNLSFKPGLVHFQLKI